MLARGVQAADGREVLVAQGAAALERWFPDEQAPRELMREVVNASFARWRPSSSLDAISSRGVPPLPRRVGWRSR
jgi:hypothetical protein